MVIRILAQRIEPGGELLHTLPYSPIACADGDRLLVAHADALSVWSA